MKSTNIKAQCLEKTQDVEKIKTKWKELYKNCITDSIYNCFDSYLSLLKLLFARVSSQKIHLN